MNQRIVRAGEEADPTPAGAAVRTGQERERNPWLVLLVLCAAVFMLLLDTTIVNVAQRKVQEGLGADLPQIQWVLDSYILTYAVFLLSFGRMGDVYGRKRLFVFGMAVFTAASGLCAASSWLGDLVGVSGVNALIASRVLQGLGGAFMMPQTLSLLMVVFPPEKRGAAMGMWGGIVALGAVVGPIVGGLIVTDYGWEWVFLINLPVGVAAIAATLAIVPESVDPRASKRFDWGGVVLSGVGIFALVFAAIEGARRGWTDPLILGLVVLGAILLVLFVWWERRLADPMMKIELFALRNFWVASVVTVVVAFGLFGIFFPMTLFLQGALGFSPIRAGLTMTPMSLMILFAAPLAGRLTDRIGALDPGDRTRPDDGRRALHHHARGRRHHLALAGAGARGDRHWNGHDLRPDDGGGDAGSAAGHRRQRLRHHQHDAQRRSGAWHRRPRLRAAKPRRGPRRRSPRWGWLRSWSRRDDSRSGHRPRARQPIRGGGGRRARHRPSSACCAPYSKEPSWTGCRTPSWSAPWPACSPWESG